LWATLPALLWPALLQMKGMFKPGDMVVVIFHDHGTRYLGKMFNDDWMRDRGFIEDIQAKRAIDLIEKHKNQKLVTVNENDLVEQAFTIMNKYDISQLPVVNDKGIFTGSLNDNDLFARLVQQNELKHQPVKTIMQPSFPMISAGSSIEEVSAKITRENNAVLVTDLGGNVHIITKYDIIDAIK
jgi:cystathionine beta-synthase